MERHFLSSGWAGGNKNETKVGKIYAHPHTLNYGAPCPQVYWSPQPLVPPATSHQNLPGNISATSPHVYNPLTPKEIINSIKKPIYQAIQQAPIGQHSCTPKDNNFPSYSQFCHFFSLSSNDTCCLACFFFFALFLFVPLFSLPAGLMPVSCSSSSCCFVRPAVICSSSVRMLFSLQPF